jgi:antitoxin (DNA-binding transcriptional repressor) of toxin-antitoxin stability system
MGPAVDALVIRWTKWTKYCYGLLVKPVKIHEAKTNFSKLIGLVENGEEVVVQRGDKPVARIVPFGPTTPRVFGALRGQIKLSADFEEIPPEFEEYVH